MRPLVDSFLRLGDRIEALPFPTLAAVHGTCMARGLELGLSCDLIWAAEGTVLGLPETTLGIAPLAGGVEPVAARSGPRPRTHHRPSRWATQSRRLRCVGRNRPRPSAADLTAERFAQRLAAGPTLAYAAVKALTRAIHAGGVGAADARPPDAAVGPFDTADARNGIPKGISTRARGTASSSGVEGEALLNLNSSAIPSPARVLSSSELADIASFGLARATELGDLLFQAGDADSYLSVVSEGEVQAVAGEQDEVVVATFGPVGSLES